MNIHPDKWPKWACSFEKFHHTFGVTEKGGKTQVNMLAYAMGDKADNILRSFHLSKEDVKNNKGVKEQFVGHFIKRKTSFMRVKFNKMSQEEGEPVDMYITALHSLAEYCSFGEVYDIGGGMGWGGGGRSTAATGGVPRGHH